MESRLREVRSRLTAEIAKQPAWMQFLDPERLSTEDNRLVLLDRILKDLLPSTVFQTDTWLGQQLMCRVELWTKRGVSLNDQFEEQARLWLRDKFIPTRVASGREIIGEVVQLDAGKGQYLAVDGADGKLRHFHITANIRNQIVEGNLRVGEVVVVSGKTFSVTENEASREIHYHEIRTLRDWKKSTLLVREAIKEGSLTEPPETEGSFAGRWHQAVTQQRKALARCRGLAMLDSKQAIGDSVTGRLIATDLDDGRKMLIEGSDGQLHLLTQGKRIRAWLSSGEIKVQNVITVTLRSFEANGQTFTYIEPICHENWKTSLALDKFAMSHQSEDLRPVDSKVRSEFAREWQLAAARRLPELLARGESKETLSVAYELTLKDTALTSNSGRGSVRETDRLLVEIPVGSPVSGIVREIFYRSNGEQPHYLAIESQDRSVLHVKASNGIARAVVEGRIQGGDEVTLATREFIKDAKVHLYTDVSRRNLAEDRLREEEVLFGRLISRYGGNRSYIDVDSARGRLRLRLSQEVKNQIKAGHFVRGDIGMFTLGRVEDKGSTDSSYITHLRVRIPGRWQETEEFDRAVVQHLRAGIDELRPRQWEVGFAKEWRDALERRGKALSQAGVVSALAWESELVSFRHEEMRERVRREP